MGSRPRPANNENNLTRYYELVLSWSNSAVYIAFGTAHSQRELLGLSRVIRQSSCMRWWASICAILAVYRWSGVYHPWNYCFTTPPIYSDLEDPHVEAHTRRYALSQSTQLSDQRPLMDECSPRLEGNIVYTDSYLLCAYFRQHFVQILVRHGRKSGYRGP